jgi:hypothetical protein
MKYALIVLLAACSSGVEKPPCDPTSFAAISATCGNDEGECFRLIEEREDYCAEKIRSGE